MRKLWPIVVLGLVVYGLSQVPRNDLRTASAAAGQWLAQAEKSALQGVQSGAVVVDAKRLEEVLATLETDAQRALKGYLPTQFRGSSVGVAPIIVRSGDLSVTTAELRKVDSIAAQVSVPQIERTLGFTFLSPVRISVFASRAAYDTALQGLGATASQAVSMAQRTGGVEDGNQVLIPLFNNRQRGDLHDVVTHELTHAVFYQNGVIQRIPTWLNEGTAWYEGMMAQERVTPQAVTSLLKSAQTAITSAFGQGYGIGISASEAALLRAPYNVELEDYFAVQDLTRIGGWNAFVRFLHDTPGDGVTRAFHAVYAKSGSLVNYVRWFDRQLRAGTFTVGKGDRKTATGVK